MKASRLLAISLLLATIAMATPPRATAALGFQQDPGPAPDIETITIEGWVFARQDIGSATIHTQPGVDPTTAARILNAIQIATAQAPDMLGAQPLPRIDFYVLLSRDELRRALQEFAGLSTAHMGLDEAGHSLTSGRYPGIYLDASAQGEDGRAMWLVAHELAHQVARQLSNGRAIPQWFNEGIAEFVGASITARLYPEYFGRRDFIAQARLASAGYAGALPVLTPLRTQIDWVQATRSGSPVYYAGASLAVRQLVERQSVSDVAQVLILLGVGVTFDDAFAGALSTPVANVDTMVSDYVTNVLAPRFPVGVSADRSSVLSNERIQLAMVGSQPGETVSWTFSGPSACRSLGFSPADRTGLSSYQFSLSGSSRVACAGQWTAVATGAEGSGGRLQFTFNHP